MSSTPKKKHTAALGFIFVTLFIDVLGLGIIIPVMPKLLETLGHVDVSTAAQYNGYLTFTYASMQFLFSSFLGNLSDRHGRRPVLLGSLIGFGIDYIFMAFAPTIGWLFIGRAIAGFAGASNTTATAYIADISTGKNRAANFGLVGAASGLGFIIGIGTGSFLGELNVKFPFMLAAGLALINATYGYFVLPESLDLKNRRRFEWKKSNPISSLRNLGRYPSLTGLIGAFSLVYIAQKSVEYVLSFYVTEKFDWTLKSIGFLGFFIGIVLVAIQGGLIRITIPKFGQEKNIIAGLLFYTIGLTLIAFASQGWMMYVFMVPYCLGGISGPSLQGMITGTVSPKEQGELQGSLTSISSLAVIIGPLLMSSVFHLFTHRNTSAYFPGAPYILGAILMLIAVFMAMKSIKKNRLNPGPTLPENEGLEYEKKSSLPGEI
ncbi:DHA1 family tetracycline resistance protein-like MFS transporter [Mucilaginibacter oryzae]|uniref:DHA1 family tetracycline resistance protein-like MFS transporter n=1 Tax=Mucilaginibacter oryzae TaxID=468058 RepID=A0A316HHT1_9SPHI|nr:TCR/Tet family MFS transporter [Mucilaginibacter oryzae]PWK79693.1 DHA1 family tetracycline resistance protein-like MFS transporter [Mucilaginibacter oryzae]